jgi:aminopeptidase N
VHDDERWWKLMRDTYQKFKYRNILTEEMVQFFNAELRQDLTAVFDQYLRRADLPVLELAFDGKAGTVAYRWRADERAFAMPVRVGDPRNWQTIRPATGWQILKTPLDRDAFEVATDLYYVTVVRQ